MQIGFVGLGKMGGAMAGRLVDAGHEVVGFDMIEATRRVLADRGGKTVSSMTELAAALGGPRLVWVMAPPGEATENVLVGLRDILSSGDIVVDGGNSDFRDTLRRRRMLLESGIELVDAGVSGGVNGAKNGCGLLVGASEEQYGRLTPIFEALAAPESYRLVGANGAGHFAKAVHNGVEYAIMQAYGEGYELLAASEMNVDVLATLDAWNKGCSVRSYLLGKLVEALTPDPSLTTVQGFAADSGMGRWTVEEAIRLRVPTPTISAALQARFRSQQSDSPTMKSIAALRGTIGGHAVKKVS